MDVVSSLSGKISSSLLRDSVTIVEKLVDDVDHIVSDEGLKKLAETVDKVIQNKDVVHSVETLAQRVGNEVEQGIRTIFNFLK